VNCREVSGFLLGYVDGELDPDVVAEFHLHLDACLNCREYLEQYRQTIVRSQAVGETVEAEIPEDLVKAVLDTLGTLKQ
jgi:anti-sigma factor RsiW